MPTSHLELYYYPGNASLFPHMLLRELDCPFELKLVDRTTNAQNSPAYLRLNPNGRIPVLVDGGEAIFETAAIGLHLADKFPERGLAPPPGTPDRAAYYKWMVHLSSTPQAEYRAWFYPHEFVDDPSLASHVKAAAGVRLAAIFERIALQLGAGPWLLGETFSAADLYLLMLVCWGLSFPPPPEHPEWGDGLPGSPGESSILAAHADRVRGRPAVQATFAAEGLAAPFI
jgi:glutathione S-transferase